MVRTASRRNVKAAAPPVATNSISNYSKVSKTQTLAGKSEKKVLAVCLPNYKPKQAVTVTTTAIGESSDEENQPAAPSITLVADDEKPKISKKRKASPAAQDEEAPAALSRGIKRTRVKQEQPDELSLGSPVLPVPIKKEERKSKSKSKSIKKEPSSSTQRKFKQTTLIASAKDDGRKANRKISRSRKIKSESEEDTESRDERKLPAELLDLLDLQRAILRTVVLQVAHQNNNTPIDIAGIAPDVSRTWGKRQVTVDDIRRCIAIQDIKAPGLSEQQESRSPFIVTDYGRGKLCLEIDTSRGHGRIDDQKLCKQFEENLHTLCAERATDEMCDLDISFESLSFSDLPKADITPRNQHQSLKQNPLLVKGHRALSELKSGMAAKQQEKEAKASAQKTTMTAPAALHPNGVKMSLLDRIRAKEAANAQAVLPSGPELARKRALQRVADVSAVIGMLVNSSNPTGMMVLSWTMTVMLKKLKDSLRVPMSDEEGVDTVKLIANEVAPEWLRLVTMGGKEHVVIQTRSKPFEAEIASRVNRL